MSGTVANKIQKIFRAAQYLQYGARNVDILHFTIAANVVDFAVATTVQNRIESTTMIIHMNPVAHVAAVAVDGQRLSFHGLRNHQWNELLRELKGAIIVCTSRHDGWKTMRFPGAQNHQI